MKVNLKDLQILIPSYYKAKKPLCLWGKPSTGKTSTIREFAQQMARDLGLEYSEDKIGAEYFTLKVIIPSQFDPVDFIGMMELVEQNGVKVTQFNPVACFPRSGQGIFYIDEISNSDPSVIASLQRLMLEGRLENYVMPATYWRVAAGNRTQDYCQTNELSLAFYRRLAHLEVEPNMDEILGYFIEQDVDTRVVAYLKKFAGEDLFPKVWDERLLEHKANPFPYTWHMAAEMIKGVKEFITIERIVGSWVGEESASRFVAFCKTISKLDIDALIADPKTKLDEIVSSPDKPSLLYALVTILASKWRNKDKDLTPEKISEIMGAMDELHLSEFAVFLMSLIWQFSARQNLLLKQPNFIEVLNKIGFYYRDDTN